MKISVIIPVYNRGREVREAIDSVLAQTLAPAEILVVDDGSTDDTAKVAAAMSPPVRLIRQENQGPAAARNRAAKEATGDWLAFLDSDDLWLPQKLRAQADHAAASPRAGLIHTDGWVIKGRKAEGSLDPAATHFSRFTPPQGPDSLAVYLDVPILTPSVMVAREAFNKAGGFDESFTVSEDADLFVRIMAMGWEAAYVADPLVIVRMLEDGQQRTWMTAIQASIRLQEKALKLFPEKRGLFRSALARSLRTAAQCAIVQADQRQSARCWLRSFKYRRPSWKELAVACLLIGGGQWGKKLVMQHWRDVIRRYHEPRSF